jgi:hypothetical protein
MLVFKYLEDALFDYFNYIKEIKFAQKFRWK